MVRILIVYGSTDGHTAKVAHVLGDMLSSDGHRADVYHADTVPTGVVPSDYDGVMVAGSIHMGGFQRCVRRWVHENVAALNAQPSAFLSVCLAVREERAEARTELQHIINRFLAAVGWRPTIAKPVAGALLYTQYNWLKRWVMRRIVTKAGGDTDTSRDYEYTDWEDLRRFERDFAQRCAAGVPAGARG